MKREISERIDGQFNVWRQIYEGKPVTESTECTGIASSWEIIAVMGTKREAVRLVKGQS